MIKYQDYWIILLSNVKKVNECAKTKKNANKLNKVKIILYICI